MTRTLRRREFLRVMAAVVAVPEVLLAQAPNPAPPPPAPVPWTLGLNATTPVPSTTLAEAVAQVEPRFFTSTQMATLERLSDVLLPPLADKPGALQAETPAFLDFFIGSSPTDVRQMYQGGLDWLDSEARKRFSLPFARLETAQADRLLQPWMRSWMSDHPPTEAHAGFINIAHSDIRSATVNSKLWSETPVVQGLESTRSGLYWQPIEPDLDTHGLRSMRFVAQPGRPLR